MSRKGRWPLRLIKTRWVTEDKGEWTHTYIVDATTGQRPRVGDLYYAPWMIKKEPTESWAPAFATIRRAPLMVMMPGGRTFCIDQRAYNFDAHKGWYGNGWTIRGTEPRITLKPSVNLVGSYHGWITDGFITEDTEGRKFTDEGVLIPKDPT